MAITNIVVSRQNITSGVVQTSLITTLSSVAYGPTGATGPQGATGPVYQLFTVPSTLNVGVGKARFYAPQSLTVSNVRVSVGTAPTGSSVIVDVLKNGSTIFTTSGNRPTILAGTFLDSSSVPDVAQATLVTNDYLVISIVQVGSSVAGSDLTVQLELQPI
jgi:hypothetical protein